MSLVRVVFVGALLFGVNCVLQDEAELGTDEGATRLDRDDPTSYSSVELISTLAGDSEATVEEAEWIEEVALDELPDEDAFDEDAFDEDAFDEDDLALTSRKGSGKITCTACSKRSCYSASHKKEEEAKERALKKCEADHERCRVRSCK